MTDNGHSTLAAALAAFQADLPTVPKTKTVKNKDGTVRYTYAPLADVSAVVLPKLGAVGLSWMTMPTLVNDSSTVPTSRRFVLSYCLGHASGEAVRGEYPLPQSGTAQDIGSAITYARRYTLCSVVGVAPDEDDDGAGTAPVEVEVPRERVWDDHAADQRLAAATYTRAVGASETGAHLDELAKEIRDARAKGAISRAQYDRLAIAGAARRAELVSGKEVTGDENPMGHDGDS